MKGYTESHAAFSPCRLYRYTLERWWAGMFADRRYCDFIMLNPSTATAQEDDPTVRRAADFAKRWGYAGLVVTNLFAYRSTDPGRLYHAREEHWYLSKPICGIVGPENDAAILNVAKGASLVMVAWGVHGAIQDRGLRVLELLEGIPCYCLGVTKEGFPKHPLYVSGGTQPIIFDKTLIRS